jgi:integrase/recombinase XerD
MKSPSTLAGLLESFFRRRLVEQRNASPATVESYRDALRLLVQYVAERTKREPCALTVTDFDRDIILDFLEQLERVRSNLAQTRNVRLTAIRSFFRHVAASDPGSLGIAQRVLAIPTKRTTSAPPRYLAEDELAAILNASESPTVQGRRDYALLLFLARTGARVSEAIGIDAADLRLEPPHQVLLRGKGRKHRRVPLAADLAKALRALCRERGLGADEQRPVFIGEGGERLTRFGVTHLVRRVVARATIDAPSLARTRVSPSVSPYSGDAAAARPYRPPHDPGMAWTRPGRHNASLRGSRRRDDAQEPQRSGRNGRQRRPLSADRRCPPDSREQ